MCVSVGVQSAAWKSILGGGGGARWRFSLGLRAEELGPVPQMLYLPSGFFRNCKWPYFMIPYAASVDHTFSLS